MFHSNIIYKLSKLSNIYILKKNSILFFWCKNNMIILKLPKYYFYKYNVYKNNIYFLFLNKFDYINFIKLFFVNYNNILSYKIYRVKLLIKGLGYRIRKITNNLYYFFFNYTNMFYLNIPNDILIKWYKKRIIILSNNLQSLKLLFINILLLKKLGPYRLIGFKYPKQIILLRRKKKKL